MRWTYIDTMYEYVGKTYNELYIYDVYANNRTAIAKCICSCGQSVEYPLSKIVNGAVKGCAECRFKRGSSKIAIYNDSKYLGKVFGDLEIIGINDVKTSWGTSWTVKCLKCGNVKELKPQDIMYRGYIACGCGRKAHDKYKDTKYIGQIIKGVEVLDILGGNGSDGHTRWVCRCSSCKKPFITQARNVINGGSLVCKSCYSARESKYNDPKLIGSEIGHCKIISVGHRTNLGLIGVEVECRYCHTRKIVRASQFLNNGYINCCMSGSTGEVLIKSLLTDMKLDYKAETKFDDLRSPYTGACLRYDFMVQNNGETLFVEYDGEQHRSFEAFKALVISRSNIEIDDRTVEEMFNRLLEYDKIKDEYARKNNIRLIRLSGTPVSAYNKLKDILTKSID